MTKLKNLFCISVATLFITACGGGGGGGSTPTPSNFAPSANASADQTVDEGSTVTLAGTGTDSDGTIATFAWSIDSASVQLTNANSAQVSFVAPSTGSLSSVVYVLTLTVTDDDGATSSDTAIVTVNTTNESPVVDAGPDQVVTEQSTVTLDASGSSDDGAISSYAWSQLSGTGVTINGNDAVVTFSAPSISTQEVLLFQVLVTDDRGSNTTDDVMVTVNPDPALNSAPTVDAGPDITTSSGQNVNLSALNFFDSDGTVEEFLWVQTSGTTVSITGADASDAMFGAPTVTVDEDLVFELTVTDNEGATGTDSVTVTVTVQPTTVTISGKATYSNVPHTSGNALDYNGITQDPIRNAVVELLQNGAIFQSSVTDLNGDYSFDVNPNSAGTFSVRVKSQALQTGAVAWDVRIVDNTNSQAIYSIQGSDFTVAAANISRPTMNATTSFNGSSYTNISGAPFHILDRVMDGLVKIEAIESTVTFPLVSINWSVNNSATSGSFTTGAIGTSFFTPNAGAGFTGPQIFVLGAEDSDTDEYDGHVIIHEWGHYFEGTLARSDSTGGRHSGNQRLDMRLAFGEGFGDAWSGIMTDDPFYRDSFGTNQSQGFSTNVESGAATNEGWYNENSTASIIYDIYDSENDGPDTISLGLKPLYDVLVGQQKNTEAFTSIFSFVTYVKDENPAAAVGIDALLNAESISGTDIWGSGETNSAGAAVTKNVLPVYTEIIVGGPAVEVCSVDDYDPNDDGNKLSNFRYVRFTTTTAGNHRFIIPAVAGQDPDLLVFNQGVQQGSAASGGDNQGENVVINLPNIGIHTLEAYEFDNTFRGTLANSNDECFTVQIQTAP